MAGWRAAELEWGRGPRVFEMFLEPTCPYSNKAFGKIREVLSTAGEDKITVKVRLQSQPWHLYSGVIVRAILAASTLDNGREAAWRVMEAVAAHREEFEFDRHCTEKYGQLHVQQGVDLTFHSSMQARDRQRDSGFLIILSSFHSLSCI